VDKVAGAVVAGGTGRVPEILGVVMGVAFADVATELAVVLEESLHLYLFPTPEPEQLERFIHRREEDRMISESVILSMGGEDRLHVPEKPDLLTYVPETIGFNLPAYLAPLIQAGFEAGFDHLHFSTGCIFMGMEDSQQLLIIFLVFRGHSFVRKV